VNATGIVRGAKLENIWPQQTSAIARIFTALALTIASTLSRKAQEGSLHRKL
jgi:hypothetical protein